MSQASGFGSILFPHICGNRTDTKPWPDLDDGFINTVTIKKISNLNEKNWVIPLFIIDVPDRLNVKSIFGIIYRVLANEGQLTENDRQTTSDHNSSFL